MSTRITSFDQLPLSPPTLSALRTVGFTQPTPIQAEAILPALERRDVIGIAQTGTGKTAAFLLPLLERVRAARSGEAALILAPTRELAEQIHTWARRLGPDQRTALLVGGLAFGPQLAALERRPSILVATPGRLVDHIDRRTVNLSNVRALVLDEADRMLDMGFRPQLDRILAALRPPRQTLLFSATMAGDLTDFVQRNLHDPVRISVGPTAAPPPKARQDVYLVDQTDKSSLLLGLVQESEETVLVFTRTRHRADRVARVLDRAGLRVQRIHADRSQSQRREALEGFRSGRYRILVATDIAARGIDVANIGRVINFDLPQTVEDYVHRIGRTARASAAGHATTFAAPEDRSQLRAIERHIGSELPRCPLNRQNLPAVPTMPTRTELAAPTPTPRPLRFGPPTGPTQRRAFQPGRPSRRGTGPRRSSANA